MILDIYKDSIEYGIQDGKELIKLGIICLFNFLILPIFLELGYSFRVIKVAVNGMINGEDLLPDFNDAISMFVDGLKVFVVKFLYNLIPMILLLIFIVIMGVMSKFNLAGSVVIFIIGLIISFVSFIFCYIISDLAVAHMAVTDESISSALSIEELFNISKSIGWLRLIGFYLGLFLIIGVILVVIGFILSVIFAVFGMSLSIINVGLGAGVSVVAAFVIFIVFSVIVGPFLTIFKSRSIGLIYNLQ